MNPAEVPLLCSAFGVSHRYVYTGALNGNLYEVDTEKGLSTVVGLHEKVRLDEERRVERSDSNN